ncbi:hypothetical protein CMK13_00160 [Candidatus Poribacteria bacterium]|nr:hypothetical protein [Candidatus Poribacteria bacterium]OUT68579.1 MAG: hypothetical protein CBB75_00040 [bacterium TMED15]
MHTNPLYDKFTSIDFILFYIIQVINRVVNVTNRIREKVNGWLEGMNLILVSLLLSSCNDTITTGHPILAFLLDRNPVLYGDVSLGKGNISRNGGFVFKITI